MLISDRRIAVGPGFFTASPNLAVLMRCAMDIRNIDVAAAGAAGVLVTHASAGFGNAVAEWVLGVMIDGARGISRSVHAYRSGATPAISMGRELRGSRVGIIGYGHIGRRLGEMALALGMQRGHQRPAAQRPTTHASTRCRWTRCWRAATSSSAWPRPCQRPRT